MASNAASPDAAAAATAPPNDAAPAAAPSAAAPSAPAPVPAAKLPTPRTRIYYNPELAQFSLGEDHPMVPHRLHLTHRLAEMWGLFDDPAVTVVREYPPATPEQLRRFHTDEYIAFLEYLDTLDLASMTVEQQQELFGDDLALFGLSVCRPPCSGSGGGNEEEEGEEQAQEEQPQAQDEQQQQQREQASGGADGAAASGEDGKAAGAGTGPTAVKAEPGGGSGGGAAAAAAAAAARQQQQQQRQQQVKAELAARAAAAKAAAASAKAEPRPGAGAIGPYNGGGGNAPPVPNLEDIVVPPQLVQLATQLLFKLAPVGSGQLTAAQQQQLLNYLRQQQLQLQQRHAQLVGQSYGSGSGSRSYGGSGSRPPYTMVRPGQAGLPGGGGKGGGGGQGSRKRKAEGGGKGGKKKSRRRRSSYSDDDDEEEEVSEDDDEAGQAAGADGGGAAAAGGGADGDGGGARGPARPSRQAATAVAALTNAVRRTEAEESEEEESEEEEEDDDEGGDCPIFPGLLRYVGLQAAGSILAARDLASGACDVAVHWGGGMHHGMPYRAFGFCYVNDLVLAILELMAGCGRVLYIDVDVHHGDGVETAFKRSEKVLSISLHKWDDGRMQASIDTLNHGKPQRPVFFPGTGKKNDLGEGTGKYFTVNVPLQDDITDDSYFNVYKAVVQTAFERFKPQAVVLQCGCDSVAGDKLGRFNLSIRGHSRCVQLVRDLCRSGGCEGGGAGRGGPNWRIPLLVTGGGGYTPPLVARCWALETAVLLGAELGEEMPPGVAAAPDLADLGPSYFKEPALLKPPRGPFCMCLDTTMLPAVHKQMDSDYSLSRLAAYLTSNMQRINIKEPGAAPAAAAGGNNTPAAAAAAADGKEGSKDGAAAKDGTGAKEGAGKEGAAPAPAAAPAPKSRSRKPAGPGVADPLRHLTAPTGYPDAEEYIQDQKERVAAGAPWAANMPPPPVPRGRKSAGAAGGGGGRAGGGGGGKDGGKDGAGKDGKNAPSAAGGGKGAAAAAAPSGAAANTADGAKSALAAAGTAVAAAAAAAAPGPHVPGLPTIMPYKPKAAAAAAGGAGGQ